jgi:hypothetical protein
MSDMSKPKEAREWLSEWMRYAKGLPVEGVPDHGGNHAAYVLRVLEKASESHKKNLASMTGSGRHPESHIRSYAASVKRIDKAIPQVRKLALAQEKAEHDHAAKQEVEVAANLERVRREHPARSHSRSIFVGDGIGRLNLPPGTSKG